MPQRRMLFESKDDYIERVKEYKRTKENRERTGVTKSWLNRLKHGQYCGDKHCNCCAVPRKERKKARIKTMRRELKVNH